MQRPSFASRFGEPAEDQLPDDIREIYETNRTKVGFVPNVFRAYAKRPDHFRAFMGYHDVLMKTPGPLSRAEREAIVVAVSSENRCQYCMTAHGAALRILGKDPQLAEQIADKLAHRRSYAAAAYDSRIRIARQREWIRSERRGDRRFA